GRTCRAPFHPHASARSATASSRELPEPLPAEPEIRREVAIAEVGEDLDDRPLAELACDLERGDVRRAGGLAEEQPLLAPEAIDHVVRLFRAHADFPVELFLAIDPGDDRRRHVLQALEAVEG